MVAFTKPSVGHPAATAVVWIADVQYFCPPNDVGCGTPPLQLVKQFPSALRLGEWALEPSVKLAIKVAVVPLTEIDTV